MKLCDSGCYRADKGKHFVLTEKGKKDYVNYNNKIVGEPIEKCDYEATGWQVELGYVEEVNIPGWTKLIGYEAVYYHNGYRLAVGNPQVFPLKKVAETYKKHYEAYPWFNDEIFIEEKSYEGVPIKEYQTFNGKEIIDADHYFGLDSCEIGSYFAEELVNEFMDMLMPACMRDDCSQLGEPIALRMDEQGTYRNTYATFKKIEDNIWEYCGDCFRGENIKRGNDPRYA